MSKPTAKEALTMIKSLIGQTKESYFEICFEHDGKTIVNFSSGNTNRIFVINDDKGSFYGVYGDKVGDYEDQIDSRGHSDEEIERAIQNYFDRGCTLSFTAQKEKTWIDPTGEFRYYDEFDDEFDGF